MIKIINGDVYYPLVDVEQAIKKLHKGEEVYYTGDGWGFAKLNEIKDTYRLIWILSECTFYVKENEK